MTVFLALSWSRLEHIQLAAQSMQREVPDDSSGMLAAEQEP
jgi:hypothetical protein